MSTIVSTVLVGGEIPPARTPFKIQDPYTGRFVWNRDDDLHLRRNGDGEELLWQLEYATSTTKVAAVCADSAETGYLLKNLLTGKVLVDESDGDERLSRGFGVKEVADHESGTCTVLELESQIWTMRPLECDTGGRRGLGRLYCIQNRRNRAYIVNGLQARGKKQLRTRVTNEESKSQAWRFILVSTEPPTVLRSPPESPPDFERPSTSTPGPSEFPARNSILRAKRCRSGDYTVDNFRDDEGSGTELEQKGERGVLGLHDRNLYWKRMPPIPGDCHDHVGRKRSNSKTAGDSNFLQEAQEGSWMSQPHWKRWISAVSDFDVSRITPKIGTCTTSALNENGSLRAGGNDLLTDSPWYFQPRLEESP